MLCSVSRLLHVNLTMFSYIIITPYMYMCPLQEICFTESCNFDGGDCFGRVQHPTPSPWANCSAEAVCRLLFSDGQCDVQCNTPGCLFDGFDCAPPSQCAQESTCLSRLDDGMCSPECNTLECPYDSKDCGDQELVSILKNCTLHSSCCTVVFHTFAGYTPKALQPQCSKYLSVLL